MKVNRGMYLRSTGLHTCSVKDFCPSSLVIFVFKMELAFCLSDMNVEY